MPSYSSKNMESTQMGAHIRSSDHGLLQALATADTARACNLAMLRAPSNHYHEQPLSRATAITSNHYHEQPLLRAITITAYAGDHIMLRAPCASDTDWQTMYNICRGCTPFFPNSLVHGSIGSCLVGDPSSPCACDTAWLTAPGNQRGHSREW
eukprot:scaffold96149_cov18-Tisochrysis_lutea.AAC.1